MKKRKFRIHREPELAVLIGIDFMLSIKCGTKAQPIRKKIFKKNPDDKQRPDAIGSLGYPISDGRTVAAGGNNLPEIRAQTDWLTALDQKSQLPYPPAGNIIRAKHVPPHSGSAVNLILREMPDRQVAHLIELFFLPSNCIFSRTVYSW